MEQNNNEFPQGLILLFVLGLIVLFIGAFTLNYWLLGIGGLLAVFATGFLDGKNKENISQNQETKDLLNQYYGKEIAKQEELIAEKKAILGKIEAEEKNESGKCFPRM